MEGEYTPPLPTHHLSYMRARGHVACSAPTSTNKYHYTVFSLLLVLILALFLVLDLILALVLVLFLILAVVLILILIWALALVLVLV